MISNKPSSWVGSVAGKGDSVPMRPFPDHALPTATGLCSQPCSPPTHFPAQRRPRRPRGMVVVEGLLLCLMLRDHLPPMNVTRQRSSGMFCHEYSQRYFIGPASPRKESCAPLRDHMWSWPWHLGPTLSWHQIPVPPSIESSQAVETVPGERSPRAPLRELRRVLVGQLGKE